MKYSKIVHLKKIESSFYANEISCVLQMHFKTDLIDSCQSFGKSMICCQFLQNTTTRMKKNINVKI